MSYIITILQDLLIQEKPTSSNYIIAKYLISHVDDVNHITTQSIAEDCHVSKATISRFCRNIGLEDFMELKMLLRAYYPDLEKKFYFERNTQNYVEDYIQNIENKIHTFQQQIDRNVLDSLIDDIYHYETVILMGHMQSANITFSLQQDLRPLNKFVECCHDFTEQKNTLIHSQENVLIIVFSATGSFFKATLGRENFMKKNNHPKIYLITTNIFRKPTYIDTVIQLDQDYNYASSLIFMQIYANLIAIGYKEKFVSKNVTP